MWRGSFWPALALVAGCGRVSFDVPDAREGFDAGMRDGGETNPPDAGGGFDAGDASVRSATVPPSEVAADCAPLSLDVSGSGFVPGMRVIATSPDAEVTATRVEVAGAGSLTAELRLVGLPEASLSIAVVWPDGESIVAGEVAIGRSPLAGAVFVDGDADATVADGSRGRPFVTIEQGLARAVGMPVVVDSSATPYEPFSLVSNASVMGCAWSDRERPRIEQAESRTWTTDANDVAIRGLDFHVTLTRAPTGIVFGRGAGLVIDDCRFSGVVTAPQGTLVTFDRTARVEVTGSWFHAVHHRGSPAALRVLRVIDAAGVDDFHFHHSELSDIGFDNADTGMVNILSGLRVNGDMTGSVYPHDIRIDHVLVHDLFAKCNGQNDIYGFELYGVNGPDFAGVFEFRHITIAGLRHAEPPSGTSVDAGNVAGVYIANSGGRRDWRDVIIAHFEPTDQPMRTGISSYFGFWVDDLLVPAPSPQPIDRSVVFDVGMPLPAGANTFDWASGFINQASAGAGSYQNSAGVDPMLEDLPGPTFLHPINERVRSGGTDGEMGAFGGPDGSWTPPSQQ